MTNETIIICPIKDSGQQAQMILTEQKEK